MGMGLCFKRDGGAQTPPQPRKKNISKSDEAILELKVTRDKLRLYQKTLQKRMDEAKAKAKAYIKEGKKDRAKIALQSYKVTEKHLQQAQNEELHLEQLVQQVEQAQITANIVEALRQGNKVLKDLQEKTPLTEIEKVMSETQEAVEYQNEISEILGAQGVTDQDLLDELDKLSELENLELKEKLEGANVPNQPLPEINQQEIKVEEKKTVVKAKKEVVLA